MAATIFISIASYMDPLLLRTIDSAIEAAALPERVHFGVVDQSRLSQREKVAALTQNAAYVHVHPRESLGACWARSTAQTLLRGQDFHLQIDAHTLFEPRWDDTLLAEYEAVAARSAHARVIVTGYPPNFDLGPYGEPIFAEHPNSRNTMRLEKPTIDPLAGTFPLTQMTRLDGHGPSRGVLVAAGFLFAPGLFVEEIPYDPLLYFSGEELAIALRAFSRGWDVWHPERIPAFHRYTTRRQPRGAVQHWSGAWESERRWPNAHLLDRHRRRMRALIDGEIAGPFGLGEARPIEAFWELAGGRPT